MACFHSEEKKNSSVKAKQIFSYNYLCVWLMDYLFYNPKQSIYCTHSTVLALAIS